MEKMQSVSTEHLASISSPKRSGNTNTLLMVAAAIAVVLSVIAIIVALVSVGKTAASNNNVAGSNPDSGSQASGMDDDKIWLLAFSSALGTNYLYMFNNILRIIFPRSDDLTGELKGFFVDVAEAVCETANRNCQMVYDNPQRCWDSIAGSRAQGGKGLMTGYYDACVGSIHSYDRARTFRFTSPFTRLLFDPVFITRPGNPDDFDWTNLSGKVIGFLDGSVFDEHCIARSDRIQGKVLSADQIRHYHTRGLLVKALTAGEIDSVFGFGNITSPFWTVVSDEIPGCLKAGWSTMTRKDNSLVDWWNPAFEELKSTSSQWQDICKDLTEEHGDSGGFSFGVEECIGYETFNI